MTDDSDASRGARSAIIALGALTETQRAILFESLDGNVKFSSRSHIKKSLNKALVDVDPEVVGDLIDLAMAYVEVALDRGVSVDDEYIESIVRAIPTDDLPVAAERLVGFLSTLLNTPAIQFAAGASLAIRSHANLLLRSAIVTDARPVFSDGSSERPAGYAIWHTLRLINTRDAYSSDEVAYEVTVDHRDLTALISQAEAALEQRLTLQTNFETSGAIWDIYKPKGSDRT